MNSAAWVCGLAVAALATGCGGGGSAADAAIDTPPGACGAEATFTGDLVNWDSTETQFCGVFGAKWTVRGDAARTSTTPPNGRFQLCIPHQAQTIVDIAPPALGSECPGLSGTPMNTYTVAGVAIASDAVIAAGGAYSARALVEARIASFYGPLGGLDAAKGQLVVHVDGTPHAVSISATHGAAQRYDGAAWAAGDTGRDVLFPNVAPGTTTITVAGGATGTGSYPIEAGVFTYVSVVVR